MAGRQAGRQAGQGRHTDTRIAVICTEACSQLHTDNMHIAVGCGFEIQHTQMGNHAQILLPYFACLGQFNQEMSLWGMPYALCKRCARLNVVLWALLVAAHGW